MEYTDKNMLLHTFMTVEGHKQKDFSIKTNYIVKPHTLACEFCVHVTVSRNKFLYNKTNQMHQFPKFTPA